MNAETKLERISVLPLARIRITKEDRSWKGTCGRVGETYIVWSREQPSPTIEGTHKPYGFSAAAYMREDFEVIPIGWSGLITIIRNTPDAIRSWRFGRRIRAALAKAKGKQE